LNRIKQTGGALQVQKDKKWCFSHVSTKLNRTRLASRKINHFDNSTEFIYILPIPKHSSANSVPASGHKTEENNMNRRTFIAAATIGAASATMGIAADKASPEKSEHGACGLSCSACRMQLLGKCPGCGQGKKAECKILNCAQMKKLTYCAQCKGYPCAKIKESGKFGDTWLKKMGEAPVPDSK
jgi:hypothetical protein